MLSPLVCISFFARFQKRAERREAAQDFAAHLGARDLLIFGKDIEIGIFLPAPGFPQTLLNGQAWQTFLRAAACAGEYRDTLPGTSGETLPVYGVADAEKQCVLAFIGGVPEEPALVWIKALAPLLGSKLVDERVALTAKGHAEAAREASKTAAALNVALSINRHELRESIEQAERELVQRREAERRLLAADRSKNEFLAMLAHELRNPLAPISSAAAFFKTVHATDQRIIHTSEVLTRQVRHMAKLIDDLLDVSRVTRGVITLNRSTLGMKTLIAEAVEQAQSLIQARNHHITVDVPDEPVYVWGDRTRLVQLISNLLHNAAKYTHQSGELSLRVRAENKGIAVTVCDNGIGISAELLPRIFDLFSQGERTPDRSQGGLGIGLALVKSLVELHGGTISAYSAGENKGSTFTLLLPGHDPSRDKLAVDREPPGNQPIRSP